MYFTGNILFMFLGIGFPFAQLVLEIAPKEPVATGNVARIGCVVSSSASFCSQMGLGNTEVIFFVPHPARNTVLAAKKPRRFTLLDSEFFGGVLGIKTYNKSLSSW
jgi:hypothetical protein